jgi:hypothetical protein
MNLKLSEKLHTVIRHILVPFLTSIAGLILFIGYVSFSSRTGNEIQKKLSLNDSCLNSTLCGDFSHIDSLKKISIIATPMQQQRLKNQFVEINNRIAMHIYLANTFYKYHLGFSLLSTIYGILASIFLILILKKGIDQADQYIINLFFTSAFISILTYNLPSILKSEQNFNDNVYFTSFYMGLRDEIQTYAIDCSMLPKDNKSLEWGKVNFPDSVRYTKPDCFIQYVDASLERNFNVPVYIDESKVKGYQQYSTEIGSSLTGH